MAERPKRNVHQPKRFDNNLEFAEVIASAKPVKKQKKDNNLYEIEVDRERKLVHIHYKGYNSRFDEWRPYDNLMTTIKNISLLFVARNYMSQQLHL